MFFVRRLSSIGKSRMYWNYREKIFGISSCVLCREIVLILERPLLEISLYQVWFMYVHEVLYTQGQNEEY